MSRSDSLPVRRPLATFRLTRSVAFQWLVVSGVGFFGFAYALGHVLAWLRGTSLEPIVIAPSSPPTVVSWLAVSIGLLVCVVVPHELLHGVFMARYGDTPRYGIGVSYFVLPYAYAETSGANYTRNQLLVALLAPFVVITAVGLAAMVVVPTPLLIVPLAANAAGSIGDLWMAAALCQYPADVRVGDPPDGVQGFGIYGTDEQVSRFPGTTLLSRFLTGSVGTLAAVAVYALLAVLLSLAFGSGDVVLGVPERGWLLVRHDYRPGGTAVLELGDGPLLGTAALGGLAWTVVATLRRRLEAA
ncbi:DUF3267 domain-containing protein [Natrinema pallidum]|uniref:DUF3267 domain-containing protein n=1 Tax=Natrinema pallidum DSM 3751 TaxID=1227495 RepID=L9YY30_9EURY|nr:DUF3267 domain-containing protein [Natrinema pallidum]ELY78392.1 hypothetical protein C487_08999 [Natrinema pallidum DSM 3751]